MDASADRATKAIADDTERILAALARYAHAVEARHHAVIIHGSILTEVQIRLQDHGQRIVRLETSRGHPAPNP